MNSITRFSIIGGVAIVASALAVVARMSGPHFVKRSAEQDHLEEHCTGEFGTVKNELNIAINAGRRGQDSSGWQRQAAGRLMAVFKFCFVPDHDHPIDPGVIAGQLDQLSPEQIIQLEAQLDAGWKRSTIGQAWQGSVP